MASDYIGNPFEVPNLWRPSALTVKDNVDYISPFHNALNLDGRAFSVFEMDAYSQQISQWTPKARISPTKPRPTLSRNSSLSTTAQSTSRTCQTNPSFLQKPSSSSSQTRVMIFGCAR